MELAGAGLSATDPILAGRRITVVSIYYAPDSTGIAPYSTALCRCLADAGALVDAVVGVPHYPRWQRAPADRPRLGHPLVRHELRDGVRLHRVQHAVPRKHDLARRALYEGTFVLTARRATRWLATDAVIAVTPSLGAVPVAAELAGRNSAPLGVVVQDLLGRAAEQSGVAGGRRIARLLAAREAYYLCRADSVAVIADIFAPVLIGLGVPPERLFRLPNHTHINPSRLTRGQARQSLGWPTGPFLLLHTGNMGAKQDLGVVVEAARLAARTHPGLEFMLLGDGTARPRLQQQATGLTNLRLLPPLNSPDYPVALAAADCLLLNERATVRDMSLPSKLTSYLSAGRPVLAAVRPDGASAAELARSGAGLRVNPGSPEALLRGAVQLLREPGLAAGLARRGQDYAMAELSARASRWRTLAFARGLIGVPVRGRGPQQSGGDDE